MTLFLGQVVKATTPDILPLFYSIFSLLLLFSVRSYSLPSADKVIVEDEGEQKPLIKKGAVDQSVFWFFLNYARLVLLMCGVVFLFFDHTIINNSYIQVISTMCGDSGVMIIVVFNAVIVDMHKMMYFEQLSNIISIDRLLKISAMFFMIKHLLTYL